WVGGSMHSTGLFWEVVRPAPRVKQQAADGLAELWAGLGDPDPGKGFRARAELTASPRGAAALLAERLEPVAAPDAEQVRRWVADLDADRFEVREQATRELARLGELARPALEEVLQKRPSLELYLRGAG